MTSSNSTSALRHWKGKLLLDGFPCKIDSTAGLARTSTQQWIAFSVLRREFDALRYDSKMVTNMFHIKRMASSPSCIQTPWCRNQRTGGRSKTQVCRAQCPNLHIFVSKKLHWKVEITARRQRREIDVCTPTKNGGEITDNAPSLRVRQLRRCESLHVNLTYFWREKDNTKACRKQR